MNAIKSLVSKFSRYGWIGAGLVAAAQAAVSQGLVPASYLPFVLPVLAYAAGHLGHAAPQK
jgi:hypothetical protein